MNPEPGVVNCAPRLLRKTSNGVPAGAVVETSAASVPVDFAATTNCTRRIAIVGVSQGSPEGIYRGLDWLIGFPPTEKRVKPKTSPGKTKPTTTDERRANRFEKKRIISALQNVILCCIYPICLCFDFRPFLLSIGHADFFVLRDVLQFKRRSHRQLRTPSFLSIIWGNCKVLRRECGEIRRGAVIMRSLTSS